MSQTLSSEREIQGAYTAGVVARDYVSRRFTSELNRLLHERQVATVQGLMDRNQPGRMLEIAPGPARLTRDLRPGGSLTCLEFSEAMIGQGLEACPGKAAWVRGNAFQLPFDACFDLVYSFRFVRHFHRQDRGRLLEGIRRVLVPGGTFVMDAVNERVARPIREANPADYPIYDKLHHPDELREELCAAGLVPVSFEPVQRCYRWQWRSQVLLGPRSVRVNRWVIRALELLSRGDGLEWIVTCRRA